jgi:DNA-binding HxlR family transcriptional regulator
MESDRNGALSASVPTVHLKNCSAREILNRVANKWTTLIIGILSTVEAVRFTELSRAIGGISQKMLTQTLRELERDGLIARKVFPQVPPRVEYSLTPLGRTLCEPLRALADWAEQHMAEIHQAEQQFDGITLVTRVHVPLRPPETFNVGTRFEAVAETGSE